MSRAECLIRAQKGHQSAFRRVLLIHTGEDPEIDLLDYVAMLSAGETTIAAYPFDGVLRSMAGAVRTQFEAYGNSSPILRALPELNLDWVFEAARDADLLVVRQGSAFTNRRATVRRILSKSPCSVCLVPARTPIRFGRVLVAVTLDESGHAVLRRALSLCHSVGADEIVVVYCCPPPDIHLDFDDGGRERLRSEHTLELYRFMARATLQGVICTPVLEESAEPHRALSRVAERHSADLMVVGRQRTVAPQLSLGLARECSAPVLQVLLPPPADGLRGKLRRFFSNPEPKFN